MQNDLVSLERQRNIAEENYLKALEQLKPMNLIAELRKREKKD